MRPRISEAEYQVILNHRKENPKTSPNGARVLVFDIETSPLMAYTWGLWKQNIQTSHILSDWFMLTWSAKWLLEDEIFSDKLTLEEAQNEDDKRITKSIWDILDQADVVIAHNGDKFDIKSLNTRFLIHGFHNPRPYQSIDTLKHARKSLRVSSNKLDYLGEFLNIGRKQDTGGFDLWKRCMNGDEEAFKEMESYNKQDVRLLEDVYLKMRPYIKPHPNLGLFIGDNISRCPVCESEKLESFGEYATQTNLYETLRCKDCHSLSKSRKSLTPGKDFNNLKISLAK